VFDQAFHRLSRASSILIATAGLCAVGIAPVPAAQAATSTAATCPTSVSSQPFLRWGDADLYSLVPGGDMESALTGWTLTGAAQRASGSEPYAATGTLGSSSLSLPAGSSAQTPFLCMSASERTFRFFIKSEGTQSTVLAWLVYKTALGNISIPAAVVAATGAWAPSPAVRTGAAIATAIAQGTVQVAIRLTPLTGASRVDDIFLDPRMHH
jgi:hypothetical protein